MVLGIYAFEQFFDSGSDVFSRKNDVKASSQKNQWNLWIPHFKVDEKYGNLEFCARSLWKALAEDGSGLVGCYYVYTGFSFWKKRRGGWNGSRHTLRAAMRMFGGDNHSGRK